MLVGAVGDPDLGPVLAIGRGGRQAGLSQEPLSACCRSPTQKPTS